MKFNYGRSTLPLAFAACAALLVLSACEDNTSSIGLDYFKDTVSYKTDTIGAGSPIVTMQSTTRSKVSLASGAYSLTNASPIMFVGRAKQGTEDMESWGVLRFPALGSDTLAKAKSVRLLLHTVAYKYGPDSTNANVDLQVYAQEGGGTITDSSITIYTSELTTTPVGSFTGSLIDSTGTLVAIPIAEAEIPKLSATSFAFVIEPGASMNHVRGFATSEGTTNAPQIEYTIQTDTGLMTLTRTATLDLHVVRDQSQTPQGEFELRGSVGERERLNFDLAKLRDSLGLTRFTTINSAVIQLHADLANTRRSNLAFDTAGPTVVRLTGEGDTSTAWYGLMTSSASQPDLYTITFGNLLELWLHDSSTYHGIEFRAGWTNRTFAAGAVAGVEDNTLNRWTFYGMDAADPTKRPRIFISHSTLK